jgi:hypothetical protein
VVDQDVPSYGCVQEFYVFGTQYLQEMTEISGLPRIFDEPIIVAALLPIPQTIHRPDCDLIEYRLTNGNYAAVQLIDVSRIVSLVGRVKGHNRTTYIVDRTTVVGQMNMLDAVNPEE